MHLIFHFCSCLLFDVVAVAVVVVVILNDDDDDCAASDRLNVT